ncbi:hypothetical protein SKAU_G00407070 [Synaphobranchus kaupii]|uniref:Uncharacterized protein n=1 Tax=Synaphobranchus kaupii TaxID=118154 RepID=A0A9Q1IAY8_SYNKA|nr:hypothetical protein SKAU_G00407070 [Synaphobranchus kaupii]
MSFSRIDDRHGIWGESTVGLFSVTQSRRLVFSAFDGMRLADVVRRAQQFVILIELRKRKGEPANRSYEEHECNLWGAQLHFHSKGQPGQAKSLSKFAPQALWQKIQSLYTVVSGISMAVEKQPSSRLTTHQCRCA